MYLAADGHLLCFDVTACSVGGHLPAADPWIPKSSRFLLFVLFGLFVRCVVVGGGGGSGGGGGAAAWLVGCLVGWLVG